MLVLSGIGCPDTGPPPIQRSTSKPSAEDDYAHRLEELSKKGHVCTGGTCSASLSQILANPEVFDGVRVTTYGYLSVQLEETALHPYREDFELPSENRVWVRLPHDPGVFVDLHGQYVRVNGVFKLGAAGHSSAYFGEIAVESIHRVEPLERKARRPVL